MCWTVPPGDASLLAYAAKVPGVGPACTLNTHLTSSHKLPLFSPSHWNSVITGGK